jgi:hypothetical protein
MAFKSSTASGSLPTMALLLSLFLTQCHAIEYWGEAEPRNFPENMAAETQCYNLPYGTVGMVNDALTYFTLVCLILGRRPLMPWSKLNLAYSTLVVAGLQIIISVTVTAINVSRCSSAHWHMFVLALGQAFRSLLAGAVAVNAGVSILARTRGWEYSSRKWKIGLSLCYLAATLLGTAGWVELVIDHRQIYSMLVSLWPFLWALVGVASLYVLGGLIWYFCADPPRGKSSTVIALPPGPAPLGQEPWREHLVGREGTIAAFVYEKKMKELDAIERRCREIVADLGVATAQDSTWVTRLRGNREAQAVVLLIPFLLAFLVLVALALGMLYGDMVLAIVKGRPSGLPKPSYAAAFWVRQTFTAGFWLLLLFILLLTFIPGLFCV